LRRENADEINLSQGNKFFQSCSGQKLIFGQMQSLLLMKESEGEKQKGEKAIHISVKILYKIYSAEKLNNKIKLNKLN